MGDCQTLMPICAFLIIAALASYSVGNRKNKVMNAQVKAISPKWYWVIIEPVKEAAMTKTNRALKMCFITSDSLCLTFSMLLNVQ